MKDDASITAALISAGRSVRITPHGNSMLPLLDGKNDSVVVGPLRGTPKKGDLVLFRDGEGALVLHRVIRVDAESRACDMLGDGNVTPEREIPPERIIGQAESICRKGRAFSVRHPLFVLYGWIWTHTVRRRARLLRFIRQ